MNLSTESLIEWASEWVPESNRARFAEALANELRSRGEYAEKRFRDGVEAAAKVAHDCAAEYDETGDDDSAGVAMAVAGAIEELAAKPVPPGVRTAKPWGEQSFTERAVGLLRSARQEIHPVKGETGALCDQIDWLLAVSDSTPSQGNPA